MVNRVLPNVIAALIARLRRSPVPVPAVANAPDDAPVENALVENAPVEEPLPAIAEPLPEPPARASWRPFSRSETAEEHQARMDREDAKRQAKEQQELERNKLKVTHRLKRDLQREMRRAIKRLIARMTQMELAWFSAGKAKRISQLRFVEKVATPAAIYLRIDTVRMPRGVKTSDIDQPEVLQDLGLSVGAPVRAYTHYEHGFWLIVERANGLASIPNYLEYSEVASLMPDSARMTDIPLGMGSNQHFYHFDIAEAPHALIAGATGFGKSVMIHNLITGLMRRAKPSQVRLVLVDLKGGIELGVYDGVPHLYDQRRQAKLETLPEPEEGAAEPVDIDNLAWIDAATAPAPEAPGKKKPFGIEPRVYDRREDVAPILQQLYYELERRNQLFKKEHVRDLNGWNYKHHGPRYLPRIICVIDEIANVMLDKKERTEVERLLADIAARGRAPGIHLVIATQRPSVDVITGLIKANFPTRIAFNTASQADSRVILDNSDAAGLGVPGRMIFQQDQKHFVCQAPFVSESFVQDLVGNLIEGKAIEEVHHNVSRQDMARYVLADEAGYLTIDKIYGRFRGQGITHEDVRNWVAEIQVKKEPLQVDEKYYGLQTDKRGRLRLVELGPDGKPIIPQVTPEDLFRWALEENEGNFGRDEIYKAFRKNISKSQVDVIGQEYENKEVKIGRKTYRLDPARGRSPRRLVTVD
jgi:hypothetical protein